MGNRGILHDASQVITRDWAHKHWVSCLLDFKGIKRAKPFSTLSNYSELFFLDEATALSAGHRPCHHCQRQRSSAFKEAWLKGSQLTGFVSMPAIDAALHSERVRLGGRKGTFEACMSALPLGTMFEADGCAYVIAQQGPLKWSFDGYVPAGSFDAHQTVDVLTPCSIVKAIAHGFDPKLHPSAMSVS
jgi:hypothetical protein